MGTTVTLSATGGTAPYSYRLVSGVGSISGNIFNASSFGTAVIGVVDASGAQNTATLSVNSNLAVATTPIYRWYSPAGKRHYFVNSGTASSGWIVEGMVFKTLTSQQLSSTTLLRCLIKLNGVTYLSSSGSCGTNQQDASLGYIYLYKAANTTELMSCFHSTLNNYLATTSASECTNGGYYKLGTLGYVPL